MNSLYIAMNLFKRVFSDFKGWLSYLLLPTLVVSLIVAFLGNEPSGAVKVGYADLDQDILGTRLIEQLSQNPEYGFIEMKEQEIKDKFTSGKLSLGIVIPADFTEKLMAGQHASIQNYYLHISEVSFALEFLLNQSARQLEQTIQLVRNSEGGEQQVLAVVEKILVQQAKQQVKTNVTDNSLDVNPNLYFVIGFMLFFVMGMILNSLGLVLEDRNQMTMSRIYAAPVRAFEIAFGNFLGSFGLGVLQIVTILVITKYALGFHYGVEFLPLFIVLAFFLLATVGIGSTVAGLVKNSSNIASLNSLIITPTCMIGGCWWPLFIMPDFMQKIANFVPQKWAIDAVEQMAAGGDLQQIVLNLGILALFAVIFLGFGTVVLKPSEKAM